MALSKGKAIGQSSTLLTKKFDYSNPAEGKLGKLTPKVNPLLKNVNMLAAIDSDEDDSEYGC